VRLRNTQCQKSSRRQKAAAATSKLNSKLNLKAKAKVSVFVIACLRSASSTASKYKKKYKKANSNDMRLSNVSAINREDRQKQADRTGTAKDVGDVAKAAGLDPTYV